MKIANTVKRIERAAKSAGEVKVPLEWVTDKEKKKILVSYAKLAEKTPGVLNLAAQMLLSTSIRVDKAHGQVILDKFKKALGQYIVSI
jgi:hypothetical protein